MSAQVHLQTGCYWDTLDNKDAGQGPDSNTHLGTQLVDEDHGAVGLGSRANQLAHGLAEHACLKANLQVHMGGSNAGLRHDHLNHRQPGNANKAICDEPVYDTHDGMGPLKPHLMEPAVPWRTQSVSKLLSAQVTLATDRLLPHISLQLLLGDEGGHGVNHDQVNGTTACHLQHRCKQEMKQCMGGMHCYKLSRGIIQVPFCCSCTRD
jgi:hypothetical protein